MMEFKINPVKVKEGEDLTCLNCIHVKILHKTKENDIAFTCIKDALKEVRVIPILQIHCDILHPKKKKLPMKQLRNKIRKQNQKNYKGAGYIQNIYDRMEKGGLKRNE